VVELGAALGFVRLVRRGALRYGNDAAACLPRTPPAPELAPAAADAALAPATAAAAGALDDVLAGLSASSGASADYFAVLVSVFAAELCGDANAHLREFWLIVPALCLSHCEALLAAKERLAKRGREAAAAGFTDDGFALGIAYLLRVLGQDKAFDTLRWHESAARHYAAAHAAKEDKAAGAAGARPRGAAAAAAQEDAAAAADMRQTKAAAMLTEANLLHFTLSGARTFFQ
jgi:WASH complex subunit 7